MLENPGDELYFGEVYRQVLQEAWQPGDSNPWERVGKSRRGNRLTQRGFNVLDIGQARRAVRVCFRKCTSAWRSLPWNIPEDTLCDSRLGKGYWLEFKRIKGYTCNYYDLFMRFCINKCLHTGCVPPGNYKLLIGGDLDEVICNTHYQLEILDACGDISLASGAGSWDKVKGWLSPKCGTEGQLCFRDANGAEGGIAYKFNEAFWCEQFIYAPDNPYVINPDEPTEIYVEGGVGPFTWFITGEGFSLDNEKTDGPVNTINLTPSACRKGQIMVVDACGNSVTGNVKSPNYWIGDEPAFGIYKHSEPCEDPESYCKPYDSFVIPKPKVLRYRCDGTFLDEITTCSGASCSGNLCSCIVEDGFFCYPIRCAEKKIACDGYEGYYWGQFNDLRTQEMIDGGCCPAEV